MTVPEGPGPHRRADEPSVVPVLEVGGSHVTAAVVDLDRARIADGTRRRLPLAPGIGPEDFLATLAEAANGVLAVGALGTRTDGGVRTDGGAYPPRGARPDRGAYPDQGTHPARGVRVDRGAYPDQGTHPARGARADRGTHPARGARTDRGTHSALGGHPAVGAHAALGTWGIAVPGPFDYARGIARYHGVGKFASLDGLAVGDLLTPRLNPRPAGLRFLNDASAFALGARLTAHPGSRRLVAITLGTGVGSAFLDRGTIVEDDPRVPPEGRVDLLTVDGRPLEDTVSTRAMTAQYTDRTGRPVDGLRELTARAAADDATARDIITSALHALGGALAPWLTAFEADTVVFGGSITAAWTLIGPPLTAGLSHHTPSLARLTLSARADGEDQALLGAAAFAARGA
ncbi:ROK family protein [Streptomyces sp. SID8382]|uniref:ROK family protein n=1 Tax=Streptomyces malaysiensis TaxID=92644 RepID=UPI000C2BFCD8|nr:MULTISPECIES: ROK family protein [unclassified Streptomyces]AUA11857.1 N-acetylmannosamine kinase [Streptomyces sp. M56]MYX54466.1 ROK family protein [Streptomyces sp. SID8382]